MIRKAFVSVIIAAFSLSANADLLVGWNFNGLVGTELAVTSSYSAANISTTVVTRGAGLVPNSGGSSINSASWAMPAHTGVGVAIASNDYYSFEITAAPGYTFDLTNVSFRLQRSNTGPSNLFLRSSADGFASDLGSWVYAGTTALDFSQPISIIGVSNVEFRLYGAGATAAAGTLRITDGGNFGRAGIDLAIFGTNVVPEPGTIFLLGIGISTLAYIRRRKA